MTRSPSFDALRGLAAIGVMVYHYSITIHSHLDPAFPIFRLGMHGVEAFFVISGYVILMTAQRSLDRWAFAWARFVRLVPAFVFCLCVTTALILHCGGRISLGDWLLNLSMVPGWFGASLVEVVYWTLGYEIAFYLVVWACLPLIRRGWTLWLCLAASPVLLWQPVVAYFILGVVGSEVVAQRRSPSMGRFRLQRGGCVAHALSPAVDFGCDPRFVAFATWLGAISYPLYLIHCTLGRTVLMGLAPTVGILPTLALTCAAMLALATAINRLVEVPIQTGLKRWRESGFALAQPVVIPEMF